MSNQFETSSLTLANGVVGVGIKATPGNNEKKGNPLYVIDGVPLKTTSEPFSKLKVEEIESVNVLNDAASSSIYGDAGKNGVILITTKAGIGGKAAQNKLEEVTVTGYGSKLGIPSVQNIRKPYQLDKVVVVSYKTEVAGKPVFTQVNIPPVFSKIENGWAKYLERTLDRNLPKRRGAPSGQYTVKVSFEIDQDGKVINVKALNDPGYGTSEEAIRIIESSPKWTPAIQNGSYVKFSLTQEVVFVLVDKE